MKIVVIGAGKVGKKLSEELSKESHDVTVIDKNIDVINKINSHQDVACLYGDAIDYEVQTEAGVDSADLVIGCTSSDETNMFSCLFAKKQGAKNTIARVRNPAYYNQLSYIKEDLGLSMVINPEYVAANEISRILRFPSAIKVETFAKGKVEILEFKIKEGSPLIGMQVSEIIKSIKLKMLICAVQRNGEVIIPDGNVEINLGDKINIAASHDNLEEFLRKVGGLKRKIKTVMIVGGGKIGYYLCKSLEHINLNMKIIDNNYDTCKELSELLPNVNIIHGDGTDNQLLEEEGIDDVDAFVSLTGIDEENIILSMYANIKNVNKVITKVSQSSFKELTENFNLDTVISPKELTSNIILRYVKAMNNSYGSELNSLYRIIENKVEALEFSVRRSCKIVNKSLSELKLKKDILIACIVRDREIIIPDGSDSIQEGDNIIIVTKRLNINDIEDIIAD
ncbi:MAG: Trk system potassium uptake protein TrkA [Peptostreptococcus russellii]|uniref:Trk system potassium uptake protein TrkA n=1 Tax=Peptostreptococcus russellii TaxID=215200 RepID=A0A2P7PYV7_9FIRM|nr:Trk system potassium transporter TrkA [Peptostreptococcus russellii]PSJ30888.1 potassium transporter TrkA [Peptostreptococcus russellii]